MENEEVMEVIDINSLDAFNDVVDEIDPDADVHDAPPPPPDGIHIVKLSLFDNWSKKPAKQVAGTDGKMGHFDYPRAGMEGGPKKQFMLAVQITIDEEGKPGHKQSVRDYPNTMVGRDVKTSAVDSYLRVLTGNAGVGLSNAQKCKKLMDLLATEPTIKAETIWEARVTEAVGTGKNNSDGEEKTDYPLAILPNGKVAKGMKNFPEKGGVHKPVTECSKTGAEARTRFAVVKLLPLSAGA